MQSGFPSRVVGSVVLAAIVAGCSQQRPVPPESRLIQDERVYNERSAADFRASIEHIVRRLETEYDEFEAHRRPTPPMLNILVLSGGGDYGSFGAGFLKAWGSVTDPAQARPQFDVVTGVSTGSLIAPFAFVGNERAYDRILKLYENPNNDWAVTRGPLFFLPGNPSLLKIDGLERELRKQVDAELIREIAAAGRENRVLGIGATNLDYNEQRIWDLTAAAADCERTGDINRFHQILLTSSAIPGAFPPRIVDGVMYVDGGCVSNILYNPNMTSPDSALAIWRKLHPDRPVPAQRIWVIINEQLHPPPQIVQPNWIDVAGAAVAEIIRASTYTALRQLANEAAVIRATGTADIEVRYVAIPDDWRDPATGSAVFDKATMDSLGKLGLKMGTDPASWKTVAGPGSIQPSHPTSEPVTIQ